MKSFNTEETENAEKGTLGLLEPRTDASASATSFLPSASTAPRTSFVPERLGNLQDPEPTIPLGRPRDGRTPEWHLRVVLVQAFLWVQPGAIQLPSGPIAEGAFPMRPKLRIPHPRHQSVQSSSAYREQSCNAAPLHSLSVGPKLEVGIGSYLYEICFFNSARRLSASSGFNWSRSAPRSFSSTSRSRAVKSTCWSPFLCARSAAPGESVSLSSCSLCSCLFNTSRARSITLRGSPARRATSMP